jgi:hypothetical protein
VQDLALFAAATTMDLLEDARAQGHDFAYTRNLFIHLNFLYEIGELSA